MTEIVRELRSALLTNRWNFPPTGVHHQTTDFLFGNIQIPFNNVQLHSCPCKVYGGSRSRCSGPELTHRYKVSAGNPITADYDKVSANGFNVKVSKNVNRSIGRVVNDVGLFAGWLINAFRNKDRIIQSVMRLLLLIPRFCINAHVMARSFVWILRIMQPNKSE